MSPRSSSLLVLLALLLLGASTVPLRASADGRRPAAIETQLDIPAFPPEVARPFSFGFRTLVADLSFIEAIQVYGGLPKKARSYADGVFDDRRIARLLTYATDLDPSFRGAYRFAGNALPHQTSDGKMAGVRAAESLLERGTRNRPDDWQIFFALGCVRMLYLSDNAGAAQAMRGAAALPGAPPYLGLLASRLAVNAGELDAAEAMAREMADQSTEEGTRREWEQRLADLDMERRARVIDRASAAFKERTGAWPRTVSELVAAGELRAVPPEPRGGTFSVGADGLAVSDRSRRLRFGGKGPAFGLEAH